VPVLCLVFQSLQEWLKKQSHSDIQRSTSCDEACSTAHLQPGSSVSGCKRVNDAATLHVVGNNNQTSNSCKRKPVSATPNASQCSSLSQSGQTKGGLANTSLPRLSSLDKDTKKGYQAKVAPLADRQPCLPGASKSETAQHKGSVLETESFGRAGREHQEGACLFSRKPQISSYLETSSKSLQPSDKTSAVAANPPTCVQSSFATNQNVTRKQLNASEVQSAYGRKTRSLLSSSVASASTAVDSPSLPPKQKETSSVTIACAVPISTKVKVASRPVSNQARNVKAAANKVVQFRNSGEEFASQSSETSEVCVTVSCVSSLRS
jgi:hypothetical protein